MIHYHIRWADSKLDWEMFQTEEQAQAMAEELRRPGENYVIEKRGEDCQRCNQIKARTPGCTSQGERPRDDLNPY